MFSLFFVKKSWLIIKMLFSYSSFQTNNFNFFFWNKYLFNFLFFSLFIYLFI